MVSKQILSLYKIFKKTREKGLWNLEIKSIRLRGCLKIHQQQTGYMVTSLKNDAEFEFRRRQYNFRTSIDLEENSVTNRDGQCI